MTVLSSVKGFPRHNAIMNPCILMSTPTTMNKYYNYSAGFHGGGPRRSGANRHNYSTNNTLSTSFFGPFGLGFRLPFDDLLENAAAPTNFTSFGTFTSFDGMAGGTSMKRTSTSTRFINGKKITTKK